MEEHQRGDARETEHRLHFGSIEEALLPGTGAVDLLLIGAVCLEESNQSNRIESKIKSKNRIESNRTNCMYYIVQ